MVKMIHFNQTINFVEIYVGVIWYRMIQGTKKQPQPQICQYFVLSETQHSLYIFSYFYMYFIVLREKMLRLWVIPRSKFVWRSLNLSSSKWVSGILICLWYPILLVEIFHFAFVTHCASSLLSLLKFQQLSYIGQLGLILASFILMFKGMVVFINPFFCLLHVVKASQLDAFCP